MIHSRITAKSQTTVPREVRRALGVGPGDELAYRIEGNSVTLTSANAAAQASAGPQTAELTELEKAERLALFKRLRRRAETRAGGGVSIEDIKAMINEGRP